MSILFFLMLFFVLTADGLIVFLTPVVVYLLTGSIEYSGLSYALWWLPRIILIPLLGKYIDQLGVRLLSVISDSIKTAGCLFLIYADFSSDLMIAIAFGIVGSLISIGNAQTLISYEKIVSLISTTKSHHANLISRMDFLGMIAGPAIGMLMIDYGYRSLLVLPCLLYALNALFFLVKTKNLESDPIAAENTPESVTSTVSISPLFYIISTPAIIFSVLLAVGNNMFDGLVESSGAALIERSMGLPVKYFGLIDVAAGICGVFGTYLYGFLLPKTSRNSLLLFAVILITASSVILIVYKSSFVVFVSCYALSIVGKVFTGNICRMIRIELIKPAVFASTSSLIVLINQLILPVIGLLIYLAADSTYIIYILMAIAVSVTFLMGLLLFRCLCVSPSGANLNRTASKL